MSRSRHAKADAAFILAHCLAQTNWDSAHDIMTGKFGTPRREFGGVRGEAEDGEAGASRRRLNDLGTCKVRIQVKMKRPFLSSFLRREEMFQRQKEVSFE